MAHAALPVASRPRDLAQTTETDYRIVPVVFGVGLIVLLWFLADGLGRGPAVLAGLFMAISPAMVFYSRYYIQEMLLVFFTLAAHGGRVAIRARRRSAGRSWRRRRRHDARHQGNMGAGRGRAGVGGVLALAWTRCREGTWLIQRRIGRRLRD